MCAPPLAAPTSARAADTPSSGMAGAREAGTGRPREHVRSPSEGQWSLCQGGLPASRAWAARAKIRIAEGTHVGG